MIDIIGDVLYEKDVCTKIEKVLGARVPIIKLIEKESGMNV